MNGVGIVRIVCRREVGSSEQTASGKFDEIVNYMGKTRGGVGDDCLSPRCLPFWRFSVRWSNNFVG